MLAVSGCTELLVAAALVLRADRTRRSCTHSCADVLIHDLVDIIFLLGCLSSTETQIIVTQNPLSQHDIVSKTGWGAEV